MSEQTRIYVVGVSESGLSGEQQDRLVRCGTIVASKRYRPLVEEFPVRILPIAPVQEALATIGRSLMVTDVGVLASGDPLFFGIARTLIDRFGEDRVEIMPALSFLQIACARFKIPWDDARVISLHGRSRDHVAAEILLYPKVILFTDHHFTPSRIARDIKRYLVQIGAEGKLDDLQCRVAENLGSDDEQLVMGTMDEIAHHEFGPVNLMIVTDIGRSKKQNDCRFGLTEADIHHHRALITKDEIRAISLHKLRLPSSGVLWDIGGGSGSISIEAARLCPELLVYTVERSLDRFGDICRNIGKFGAFNIIALSGSAPEMFSELPDPDRIFVGGSGGNLEEILRVGVDRLREGGRVVVNCVTRKTVEVAPRILAAKRCKVSLSEVQVNRIPHGAEFERRRIELNPITIVTGIK